MWLVVIFEQNYTFMLRSANLFSAYTREGVCLNLNQSRQGSFNLF